MDKKAKNLEIGSSVKLGKHIQNDQFLLTAKNECPQYPKSFDYWPKNETSAQESPPIEIEQSFFQL
jgi:hypothetical protein